MNHALKPHFLRLLAACAVFLAGLPSARAQIKVACVGDSITAGFALADPGTQSYPAQLQLLLGSGYTVGNFGLSAATLLKQSDFTYWNSSQHSDSLAFSPNIVVIMLGTNDTKSWNWNATNFAADYNDLIAQYQALPTQPRVYLCLSPPVYTPNAFGTTFDPAFVQNTLVPAIQAVAADNGVRLIDNNTPLLNHPELFSDGVHPTTQGAGVIASTVAEAFAVALPKHSLQSTGSTAPSPGPNDISQLATSNTTWPDSLNYFTDNSVPAGQTFTTGATPMKLKSVAIKTAGLNSGGGYGTPASTPTYHLRIYSISGNTATRLISFSAPNPGYTDGDWLQWSGINVPLEANNTYAFSCGIKPSSGGWAALSVASNTYAGGEIALIPIDGGAITTGASHSYDATFSLGLEPAGSVPTSQPLPMPTYGWNLGNTLESTWGYQSWSPTVFYAAANAGFNAVRIPCAWDHNSTDGQINPAFLAEVKLAVDAALACGMHAMINIHWDGGWLENNITETVDPAIDAKMHSFWTQIATAFAGYDNRLLFGGANEPNVDSPAEMQTMMAYYQTFINAVRGVGGNNTDRWLVLQSVSAPSWMNTLPTDPTPGRLMVEYHCYTPTLFTLIHDDQTWGNSMYFWGEAYHYPGNPGRNATFGEEGDIDAEFQQLKEQYVDQGVPVLIGELGAFGTPGLPGAEAAYNRASVIYWNKYVAESARAHGLSPFFWSTPGSIFNWDTGAVTDAEVLSVLNGGAAPPPPNGAPYAPSGLAATTAGTGQINLSWTAAGGATSYNLYRSAQAGGQPVTPVVTGITGTSSSDAGLNDGTTYYYRVAAVNGSGTSGFSGEAHATTPGVNPDPTRFHFETDTQNWSASGGLISGIATSSTRAFAGNRSLAVNFNGTSAGNSSVSVSGVVAPAGTTISFRVWIPSGSPITVLEPYMSDYNWGWAQGWYGSFTPNAWNTFNVTVPANSVTPLKQLGLKFTTNAAWTGTVYVDSVNWDTLTESAAPAGLTAVGGSGRVTLNWSATATAATYSIKRSTTPGSGHTTIGTSASPSFTDTGVVNGTTYYYVVSAANAAGEGDDSAEASAMPTEMRARYTFEGNAQDTSGNAFHGTPVAVTYAPGQVGAQAGQFDGTGGSVSIPRSVTDDFTVTMWVKTTDNGGGPGAQWWAGKGLVDGEVGGGGADWGTALVDGKFVLGVGAAGGDTSLASSVNINDGAWHHVAATRNNTTGAMEVYVDGVPRGSGTGPTGSRTFPPGLSIGSLQTGDNFLNGTLDDVRLYDRILTGSEIAAFVNTPPELAAIGDRTVNVGQTVDFTAGATDGDEPLQALSYTLLEGPANATLEPNSGAFSFRPLVTQADTSNQFTLEVADNGTPPLSATRTFSVTVNPLATPSIGNVTFAGGQFSLQVNGQVGPDYRIETSTNLTHWTPVHTASSPAMPFTWTDTDTDTGTDEDPRRFYRVTIGPPFGGE